MLKNISIILVETSHPGNIGSAARAMKTMGLNKLVLVNPHEFPHQKAYELAAGADDRLDKAIVTQNLAEAIADKHLIIGTSARDRSLEWPMLTPKAMAELIVGTAADTEIALVFGRENSGLNNQELQQCHYHVQIPANPEYSSLNLAAAVQILVYEIYQQSLCKPEKMMLTETDKATAEANAKFYVHLEDTLRKIQFLKPNQPNRIMQRLRRLYQRAQLTQEEIDILRGILTEINRQC